MNQIMRNLISLANLSKCARVIKHNILAIPNMFVRGQKIRMRNAFSNVGRSVSGQVATLLLLIIAVALALVLATINIGEVAVKTTNMSKVADVAALQLASQLSSKALQLRKANDNECEHCEPAGLLQMIVAIFVAIVVVVVCIVAEVFTGGLATPLVAWAGATLGPLIGLMFVGAVAGAAGGALGGAIMGLEGEALISAVLNGAQLGAAIGGIAAGIAGIAAGASAAGGGAGAAASGGAGGATGGLSGAWTALGNAASSIVDGFSQMGQAISSIAGGGNLLQGLGQLLNGFGAVLQGVYNTVNGVMNLGMQGLKSGLGWLGKVTHVTDAINWIKASKFGKWVKSAATAVKGFMGKTALNIESDAVHIIDPTIGIPNVIAGSSATLIEVPKAAITVGELLEMSAYSGFSMYNKNLANRISAGQREAYLTSLNSLSEQDAIREGAFFNAFLPLIDDPRMTSEKEFKYDCDDDGVYERGGDPCDADGDGNTKESISYFDFWWDRRIAALKIVNARTYKEVKSFWNNEMADFKDFVKDNLLLVVKRKEVEGSDGQIVKFLRDLENDPSTTIDFSFWAPGPTKRQMCIGLEGEELDACLAQPLPSSYDELDAGVDLFQDFIEEFKALDDLDKDLLAKSWMSWFPWYYDNTEALGYDPSDDESFNASLGVVLDGYKEGQYVIKGLRDWIFDIKFVGTLLPPCQLDPATGKYTNSPCKTAPFGGHGSTDEDAYDEFGSTISLIQDLINRIEQFRGQLAGGYNKVMDLYEQSGVSEEFGGLNPCKYTWTDNKGGIYNVEAEVGDFKVPYVKRFRKKTRVFGVSIGDVYYHVCFRVMDWEQSGDRLWIRVKRKEPVNKIIGALGTLGIWNPGSIGSFERTARAAYSWDNAWLMGIEGEK